MTAAIPALPSTPAEVKDALHYKMCFSHHIKTFLKKKDVIEHLAAVWLRVSLSEHKRTPLNIWQLSHFFEMIVIRQIVEALGMSLNSCVVVPEEVGLLLIFAPSF